MTSQCTTDVMYERCFKQPEFVFFRMLNVSLAPFLPSDEQDHRSSIQNNSFIMIFPSATSQTDTHLC